MVGKIKADFQLSGLGILVEIPILLPRFMTLKKGLLPMGTIIVQENYTWSREDSDSDY